MLSRIKGSNPVDGIGHDPQSGAREQCGNQVQVIVISQQQIQKRGSEHGRTEDLS